MTDPAADHEALLRTPTAELWELELRNMLDGYRALYMHRFGGAEQLVETLIAESGDEAVARTAFRRALRLVVSELTLRDWRTHASAACILDLLGAYLPAAGFGKLLSALEAGELAPQGFADEHLHPAPRDLRLKAIYILASYYPSPPVAEVEQRPFRLLVDLLRRLLPDPLLGPFAVVRLLELGSLEASALVIMDTITSRESALDDLLSFIISPTPSARLPTIIGAVYRDCLQLGREYEARFLRALERAGAEFLNAETGPAVRLPSGTSVPINLPWERPDVSITYMKNRHVGEAARGLIRLSEITDTPYVH